MISNVFNLYNKCILILTQFPLQFNEKILNITLFLPKIDISCLNRLFRYTFEMKIILKLFERDLACI